MRENQEKIRKSEELLKEFRYKYFNSMDKEYYKRYKPSKAHAFEIGDLILVKRMQRTRKISPLGYFTGPGIVLGFGGNQQLKVAFLLSGKISKRHYSQCIHFRVPVCGDEEEAKKFFGAPKLSRHLVEGKIVESKHQEMLQMIESGKWDRQYIQDLEELGLLVEWDVDPFDEQDFEEEFYTEEQLRQKYEDFKKQEAQGKILRGSSQTNKEVLPQFHITPDRRAPSAESSSDEEELTATFNEQVQTDIGGVEDLRSENGKENEEDLDQKENLDGEEAQSKKHKKVRLQVDTKEPDIKDIGEARGKRKGRPPKGY